MFVNMRFHGNTEVDCMLNEMKNSKCKFYLTGSKLFGGATEKSDWDFFVMSGPSSTEFLKMFRKIADGYGDSSVESLYAWSPLGACYDKIHIQVIHPIWMGPKIKVNEALCYPPLSAALTSCPSSQRKDIWNRLMNLAR